MIFSNLIFFPPCNSFPPYTAHTHKYYISFLSFSSILIYILLPPTCEILCFPIIIMSSWTWSRLPSTCIYVLLHVILRSKANQMSPSCSIHSDGTNKLSKFSLPTRHFRARWKFSKHSHIAWAFIPYDRSAVSIICPSKTLGGID